MSPIGASPLPVCSVRPIDTHTHTHTQEGKEHSEGACLCVCVCVYVCCTQVGSIRYLGDGGSVYFAMLGPGGHWCGNVNRKHKSHHVYVIVDYDNGTWTQKCFGECDTHTNTDTHTHTHTHTHVIHRRTGQQGFAVPPLQPSIHTHTQRIACKWYGEGTASYAELSHSVCVCACVCVCMCVCVCADMDCSGYRSTPQPIPSELWQDTPLQALRPHKPPVAPTSSGGTT